MKHSPSECDKAIAALLSSTKRKKRPLSLVQIAKELQTAIECFGDIRSVSERIGISLSMARRFQYVDRLQKSLSVLVDSRNIDSIDAVAELSSLPPAYQDKLATILEKEPFATEEIRSFVRFINNNPELPLSEIVEKVRASRTIRLYVYEFTVRGEMKDIKLVENNILKVLSCEDLVSVELQGATGRLKVGKSGKERISREAKSQGLTLNNYIQKLCEGLET